MVIEPAEVLVAKEGRKDKLKIVYFNRLVADYDVDRMGLEK